MICKQYENLYLCSNHIQHINNIYDYELCTIYKQSEYHDYCFNYVINVSNAYDYELWRFIHNMLIMIVARININC